MRIALDGTPLTVPTGGIRRYTLELARALQELRPDDQVSLVSDQDGRSLGPLSRRWWSFGVQRELARLRADVFHGTDFAVPYVPIRPSVLTLHDLSPWRDPAWHTAAGRIGRRTPYLLRLGIATMVITPTEAIRRETIERFQLHPDRVAAIPEAASPSLGPIPVPPPEQPYLLYVGTLEPRKNLETLIAAWRSVRRRCPVRLVLAGRVREDFTPPAPEPGLELTGAVADAELPALYSGAVAFVYPSLYEGFGLPVLEAMQCGAAVIASDDAALREVSGGAALHVPARDTTLLAQAIEAIINNPERLAHMRCASVRRAASFTWAATARRTREVYVEAISRF